MPRGIDPLSPDNLLLLGIGPLAGTGAPGSDRVEMTAKSPINNGLGTANAGCYLGVGLRKAGYAQIIIKGKSPRPSYIFINNDEISIKDASNLWGKDVWDTHEAIYEELNDRDVHIMCIGPAGEKLVRFANVQSDKYLSFSRGGLGAVMGSKNLKAIIVKGNKKISIADRKNFINIVKQSFQRIKRDPLYPITQKYGTMLFIAGETALDGNVSAEYFYDSIKEKAVGCYSCPLQCSHEVKIEKGPYKSSSSFRGGEVAPVRAFGGPCGIKEFEPIIQCTKLCAKLGIDMLAAGSIIGWVMTCYEKGLINSVDTGGVEAKKGNVQAVLKLIELICSRKGFGGILAEGSQRAARFLGKGTENYLINIKGVELQVDPRPARPGWAWGFSQAVSARSDSAKSHVLLDFPDSLPPKTFKIIYGKDKTGQSLQELVNWFAIDENIKKQMFGDPPVIKWRTQKNKALMAIWAEELSAVIDSLGVCKRFSMDLSVPIGGEEYAKMLAAATGFEFDCRSIMKAGERIINLQRLFNIREKKITREDDYFTPIIYEQPLNGNHYPIEEFEEALNDYYNLRGWDSKTGIPTIEKIKELELEDEFRLLEI